MIKVDKIIHSRRRTVSLVIQRDGLLVVRAPKKISAKEIERLVNSKQAWIQKHLEKIRSALSIKKEFRDGESFLHLGQSHPLRIIDEYRSRLIFHGNEFCLSRHKIHQGKRLFQDWYARQAAEVIFERVKHYADLMGVRYKRISITSAQTRWGSCSSQSTINFSWRLVLAPLEIIDSVVVHELAHLIHHDHSKNFWAKVRQYYPDYQQARKWLNKNGHSLQI